MPLTVVGYVQIGEINIQLQIFHNGHVLETADVAKHWQTVSKITTAELIPHLLTPCRDTTPSVLSYVIYSFNDYALEQFKVKHVYEAGLGS